MMNDGNEWQLALPEFLSEAEKLLTKSQECLSHLHLIRNDSDAIDCMKISLIKLAEKADAPLTQWDATVATLRALGCQNVERVLLD